MPEKLFRVFESTEGGMDTYIYNLNNMLNILSAPKPEQIFGTIDVVATTKWLRQSKLGDATRTGNCVIVRVSGKEF